MNRRHALQAAAALVLAGVAPAFAQYARKPESVTVYASPT